MIYLTKSYNVLFYLIEHWPSDWFGIMIWYEKVDLSETKMPQNMHNLK